MIAPKTFSQISNAINLVKVENGRNLSVLCPPEVSDLGSMRSPKPEMTLGIMMHKRQKNAGDDESNAALQPTGRIIQNPTQGYQWPHKLDLGPTKT